MERIIEAINEDPPPMYNPNGIDTMVLWDKSKFENMISGIITNPVVRYKMIIQKLRYGVKSAGMKMMIMTTSMTLPNICQSLALVFSRCRQGGSYGI